jgi:hypothetical protein
MPNPPPPLYFDGQLPSLGYELLRSANVTGFSLLESQQVEQQGAVLEIDRFAGTYTGDVQNVRYLTSADFKRPPTLDPSYGAVMDTTQNVYRNIAQFAPIFEG